MSGLMRGKRGLVMGVANDHSIAWGIAKKLADEGAELAFTYQGDALGKRVRPLADLGRLEDPLAHAKSRTLHRSMRLSGVLGAEWGNDRLPRARHRLLRQERVEGALRRHDAREFHPHHGDLVLLVTRDRWRAAAIMNPNGSMITLTYGGSTPASCRITMSWASPRPRLESSVRYLAMDFWLRRYPCERDLRRSDPHAQAGAGAHLMRASCSTIRKRIFAAFVVPSPLKRSGERPPISCRDLSPPASPARCTSSTVANSVHASARRVEGTRDPRGR